MIPGSLNTMMMGGGQSGPPDPFWSNVSLLMLADSGFVDLSSQAFTVNTAGSITTSTTDPIVGASSYLTDRVSTEDGLRIVHGANNALNFGTGDFTMEMWLKSTEPNGGGNRPRYLINNYDNATIGAGDFALYLDLNSGATRSVLFLGATGTNVLNIVGLPVLNAWSHEALVRQSGTYRWYRNGGQIGSTTTGGTANLTSPETDIFYSPYFAGFNLQGFENAIRITKGVCRYPNGTTFTPPTTFPTF